MSPKHLLRRGYYFVKPATNLISILAAGLGLASACHAADLTASYQWSPVRLGAGGCIGGMVVHPTAANVRYARADTCTPYVWNQVRGEWVPIFVNSSLPASVPRPASEAPAGIAIDPSDASGNKVLIAAYGKVYRSNNRGVTFTESTGINTVEERVYPWGERIQVDPNNGNIVYYGTYRDGFYRSYDGGASWVKAAGATTPAATDDQVNQIIFDKSSGTTAQNFGGGTSYTVTARIYLILDRNNHLKNAGVDDSVNDPEVFVSTDGGGSWTQISTGQTLDKHAGVATVDPNGKLYVGDRVNRHLWRYANNSGTWSWTKFDLTSVAGSNGQIRSVAVDPSNPLRIFAAGNGSKYMRSLNGGTSWVKLTETLNTVSLPVAISSGGGISWLPQPTQYTHETGGIYIDPVGTTGASVRLFVPEGNEGMLRSDVADSSNTAFWTVDAKGIEQFASHVVVHPPVESGVPTSGRALVSVEDASNFYIDDPDQFTATHNSLQRSTNSLISNGIGIAYCPNKTSYVVATSYDFNAGTGRNFSGYSTDGGKTYTKFASINASWVNNPVALVAGAIAVSKRASGKVLGEDNIVWFPAPRPAGDMNPPAPFYSTNGGATWTQSASLGSATASDGTPYADGVRRMGWQGGLLNFAVKSEPLCSDPVTPGVFYLYVPIGNFQGVWKTTNGGVTWAMQSNVSINTTTGMLPIYGFNSVLRAVPGTEGDLWFASGASGVHGINDSFYHSTNGGVSWTKVPGFTKTYYWAYGKAAPGSTYPALYVAGIYNSAIGIYRSIDQGSTWDKITDFPTGATALVTGMDASKDVFGLVTVALRGNSFVYGKETGVFLSDLNWSSETHYSNVTWKKNLNVNGGSLVLNGVTQVKGLGGLAGDDGGLTYSQLVYTINGQYNRFIADVGQDASAGGDRDLVFEVWGDGVLKYQSPIQRRGMPPAHIDISISGVAAITLKSYTMNGFNLWSMANWGNAKFQ